MRISKTYRWSLLLIGTIVLGCLDPYSPPTGALPTDFLVVDGVINATNNSATVKLSRATALADTTGFLAENDATVFVEDENNQKYELSEVSDGLYSVNQIFDSQMRYRLSITSRGEEIASEFVDVIRNAPIDSLTWRADGGKLTVFVNSHDFSEGKKYYRYNYDETHEYTSEFFSSYVLENFNAVYRTQDNYIYWCFTTRASSSILLTSTENLAQNIISGFPIVSIRRGDRRLWHRYSVLVRQMSLSKDAFEYWEQLRKMSESLGGLFDPMPYQVSGNIMSVTNPEQPVLGYFSAGEIIEKRIVVPQAHLPGGYGGVVQASCEEKNVKIANMGQLSPSSDILTYAEVVGIAVVGYFYSTPACTDCRLDGGTNVRPDFMK